MEQNWDSIVFEDEEGNEITLDVLDTFDYKSRKFVVLCDHIEEDEEAGCGCECECDCDDCSDGGIYIMEAIDDGEYETFVNIDDEQLLNEVIETFESRLD